MQIHEKTSSKQKIILIIFGLFLCVLLLEVGLRIGGFILLSQEEHRNKGPINQKGTYRIMSLGESTTFNGESNSYPRQLERILNQRNSGIKFKVINKGRAGIESTGILAKLENNINKYNPDMIIVMMGINDGEDTVAYADIHSKKNVLFFKSFRIYKLAKLLRLHIIQRFEEKKLDKAEESLKKALEINPKSEKAYVGLVDYYQGQEKFVEAEELIKKALEINPKSDKAYLDLARYSQEQGKFVEAEELIKKALEINPKNNKAYIDLAHYYWEQGKRVKAEEVLKKAIEINPKNYEAYFVLADYYGMQEKNVEAEELPKKVLEIHPKNDAAYVVLAYFRGQENSVEAKELLEKAIEINPKNTAAYTNLAYNYQDQGKLVEAIEMLKKALEADPGNDNIYYKLSAMLNKKNKKRKAADEYSQRIGAIDTGWYEQVTIQNYRILKEIVTKKGIKLVSMQYPVRSVEPLKKIFKDKESLVFVDNEKIFKEAVARENYDEYFTDKFRDGFGHCTVKGNRLLAENAANVILKEFF